MREPGELQNGRLYIFPFPVYSSNLEIRNYHGTKENQECKIPDGSDNCDLASVPDSTGKNLQ